MVDDATKKTLSRIPLMKTRAGPRDGDQWVARLREELGALIEYVKTNKQNDSDWVEIQSNADGTKWHGQCWHVHAHERYQFAFEFEIPVAYPDAPPEIAIPSLDGRTAKMYRGGYICLSDHFKPLWSKNAPKFGISHALALGVSVRHTLLRNFFWRLSFQLLMKFRMKME